MDKHDIQVLYEYDRWANRRVLQAASALTPEQFTRDLGGGFRSLRDTLVHIIGGEWFYLAFWKAPSRSSALVADLKKRHTALFEPSQFTSVAAVASKWAEVEAEQAEFVRSVTNESLAEMVPVREAKLRLAETMQHLANHSTYHRGQVALMMRQLGAEPLPTDFHVFLMESRDKSLET